MNRYSNFILELADYRAEGARESLSVRVMDSPGGLYQNKSEAAQVEFPEQLRDELARLERRDLSMEELMALGEDLAEMLLPRVRADGSQRSVRDFYHRSRLRLKSEEGLRIQIRADAPELSVLPWEYVYVADPDAPEGRKGRDGFLALDREISIVRYENLGETRVPEPRKDERVRVLALLSEVRKGGWPELDLAQDEANLLQALEGMDEVDLELLRPGTLKQFESYLSSTGEAGIFHFSGHGEFERRMGDEPGTVEGQGRLILAGEDGAADPVSADNLAIDLNSRNIRLAVLGACEVAKRDAVTPWSGIASSLLQKGFPAVVAMQYTVRDQNAIAFSRRLYQALAAGKSIDTAVSEGRLGINHRAGSSERDWGVPVLYLRTDNTVLFPKPMKPYRINLVLFLATVGVLTAWYYWHVYDLVAYKLERFADVIGISAAPLLLAGFNKLLSTARAKWHRRERDSLFDRWLHHRRAPVILGVALVLCLLLFFTTNSLYLDLGDEKYGTVEIAVFEQGEDKTVAGEASSDAPSANEADTDGPGTAVADPVDERPRWGKMPELKTDYELQKTLDGGFFLSWPWGRDLELAALRPFGMKLKEDDAKADFGWLNRSRKLKVAEVLEKDDSRAIRLLLDGNLLDLLPSPYFDGASGFEIKITYGDNEPFSFKDAREGVYYFGTHQAVLNHLLEFENLCERRERLRMSICGNELKEVDFNLRMAQWNFEDVGYRHFRVAGNGGFLQAGQDVRVEFGRSGGDEWEPLACGRLRYSELEADRLNILCLYESVEGCYDD